MIKRSITRVVTSCLLGGILATISTSIKAADIADNFTLPYRGQPGNLSLYDFQGQVILLEFFEAG